LKIAIVHDWLVTDAGAEKVLAELIALYPHADLFTLVDFLKEADRKRIVGDKKAVTSFVQKLPFAKNYFRHYLPLFPKAIESLDVSVYDLVISSSWAVAKGVKTTKAQMHICYCHTPVRYAWDLYDEYTQGLRQPKKIAVEATLRYLRRWDAATADRVDAFVANSYFVAERIRRIYKREAAVIYPPVDTEAFALCTQKDDFYLTASRLVPYKKTKLIVEAFNAMPDKKLVVIGAGEEYEAIRGIAGPNVSVLGYQPREVLVGSMRRAKAFVYAALEDFGIVPVEAMACGTPVIALDRGGTAETVEDGVCGVHFSKQDVSSIVEAVRRFETMHFDPAMIRSQAERFAKARFVDHFCNFVKDWKTGL